MVEWSGAVLEICDVSVSFYAVCVTSTGSIFRNTRCLVHSFALNPVLARCSDKKLNSHCNLCILSNWNIRSRMAAFFSLGIVLITLVLIVGIAFCLWECNHSIRRSEFIEKLKDAMIRKIPILQLSQGADLLDTLPNYQLSQGANLWDRLQKFLSLSEFSRLQYENASKFKPFR